MGKPMAGANLWSELADRQARRLAEGQTTHSPLQMGVYCAPRGVVWGPKEAREDPKSSPSSGHS